MCAQRSEAFDSDLVRQAGELWERGTQSPFLEGVRDGSLSEQAFQRWLVQDYHFVTAFMRFVATLLSRSERDCQALLVQGIGALDDELRWFEGHAAARGLGLDGPLLPTCRRYNDFMLRIVHEESVGSLYAVLYGIEVSYYAGWSNLTPEGPYQEFIERWSNPEFGAYVAGLRELADGHIDARSQPLFDEVLRHEEAFWTMTLGG
jgi:thiaminase/transcriptional activator TenA